jgi:hypothetical protein
MKRGASTAAVLAVVGIVGAVLHQASVASDRAPSLQ